MKVKVIIKGSFEDREIVAVVSASNPISVLIEQAYRYGHSIKVLPNGLRDFNNAIEVTEWELDNVSDDIMKWLEQLAARRSN